MSFLLRLTSSLRGRKVGTDRFGNVYYEGKASQPIYDRPRRWAIYAAGGREPTVVPPEWHAWLHYTTDEPIPLAARKSWQKPHQPNMTGTAASYRPPGHDYRGGNRSPATGDYESWTPGS